MVYFSIRFIGLSRTQVLTQTQPVWSTLMALAFLGERLTLGIAAGTAGIVGGAILLVRERRADRAPVPLFRFLVPVLASFTFALSPILRKFGLVYIPSVTFGMGFATLLAAFFQTSVLPIVDRKDSRRWNARSVRAAIWGACLNTMGGLCFWMAIKEGEVIQVAPIRRISVLFVLILSWWFFRKEEQITLRVAAGAGITVAGAALIVWSG